MAFFCYSQVKLGFRKDGSYVIMCIYLAIAITTTYHLWKVYGTVLLVLRFVFFFFNLCE